MHWTEPATVDDSNPPDCGDTSPLSHRDMSRAKSAVVPAQSEGANVGQAVNEAMRAIPDAVPIRNLSRHSETKPDLADVLPKSYHILESRTLASLLKTMASISMDKSGVVGRKHSNERLEVLHGEARDRGGFIVESVTELLAA